MPRKTFDRLNLQLNLRNSHLPLTIHRRNLTHALLHPLPQSPLNLITDKNNSVLRIVSPTLKVLYNRTTLKHTRSRQHNTRITLNNILPNAWVLHNREVIRLKRVNLLMQNTVTHFPAQIFWISRVNSRSLANHAFDEHWRFLHQTTLHVPIDDKHNLLRTANCRHRNKHFALALQSR